MNEFAEYDVEATENLIEDMHDVFNNYAALLKSFQSYWMTRWFVSEERDEKECYDRLNDAETCLTTLKSATASLSEYFGTDVFDLVPYKLCSRDDYDEILVQQLLAREAEKKSEN